MTVRHKFRLWLDRTLKNDVYELRGSEILRGRGSCSENRLSMAEVRTWQIYPEMGFDVVEIQMADGQKLRWIDKYNDLVSILRSVLAERKTISAT
jgi:hypothetical protein